jgi:hypothetical protein
VLTAERSKSLENAIFDDAACASAVLIRSRLSMDFPHGAIQLGLTTEKPPPGKDDRPCPELSHTLCSRALAIRWYNPES